MWLIVAFGATALLLYCLLKKSDYWETQGVPTASGRKWFFGHYKDVLLVKKHIADLYGELYNEFPDVPVVGYYKLSSPALTVRDPELIRTILTAEFSNFSSNGFDIDRRYDYLAGWNPFFLDGKGEDWKISRAHATPALSTSKLKGYLPRMLKVADEMVKYVRDQCKETKVAKLDLKDVSTMFTTDVFANAICGIENNIFHDKKSLFAEITGDLQEHLKLNVIDNIKSFMAAALPVLNRIFQIRFISKKLERLLISLTRKIMSERISGAKRNDFYQVMMGFRENDTEGNRYISCHLFTILLDLCETSGNALMSALFTLAWHPEYQEKLRSEIRELDAKLKGEYTLEDVEKFKYLDMILCESLRLYTPISVLSRKCTNDCTLILPGEKPLRIIRGTPIIIPVANIHADTKYYPQPEKFDPERFSDEEIGKRPKFTFMPFGEGPKKCLGMRIGSLEVKVAIMSIIRQFKLKPCPKSSYPLDIEPRIFLFSRPTRGAWVYFEEVK